MIDLLLQLVIKINNLHHHFVQFYGTKTNIVTVSGTEQAQLLPVNLPPSEQHLQDVSALLVQEDTVRPCVTAVKEVSVSVCCL